MPRPPIRRLLANLAVFSLLLGAPACACAASSEQVQNPGEDPQTQHHVAPCHAGEPHPIRHPDCPPAHDNSGCAHCVQLDAQTAKIERVVQRVSNPWIPETIPATLVFVTAHGRVQPLVPRSDLPPPFSSRRLLGLICTLLI